MLNEILLAVEDVWKMRNVILLAINFAACGGIFIALFHYVRDGARFRRGVSFLAMLLMVSSGANVSKKSPRAGGDWTGPLG